MFNIANEMKYLFSGMSLCLPKITARVNMYILYMLQLIQLPTSLRSITSQNIFYTILQIHIIFSVKDLFKTLIYNYFSDINL